MFQLSLAQIVKKKKNYSFSYDFKFKILGGSGNNFS